MSHSNLKSLLQRIHSESEKQSNCFEESQWILDCIGERQIDKYSGKSNALTRKLTKKAVAVVTVFLLVLSSASISAWYAMRQEVLLFDRFDDGWFDSSRWKSSPEVIADGGVREEIGHIRLVNRGYLIPQKSIRVPFELQFEWKWTQMGLHPTYSDHLTIALRTSARPKPSESNEVDDGLRLKINAWAGSLLFADSEGKELLSTKGPPDTKVVPLPADTWYLIRIRDDGQWIECFVDKVNDPKMSDSPVIRFESNNSDGDRFCIYNREATFNAMESSIRNLVVKRISVSKANAQ